MTRIVTYWFAVVSPYAYLGHERVREVCRRRGATLEPKPVDMGKVFAATGGVPLAQRPPARRAYRLAELQRWSAYLHLPLNLHPKHFPTDSALAARMVIAARTMHGAEAALDLAGACLRAVWVDELELAQPDVLIALADRCGLDGRALREAGDAASAVEAYARDTEAAIARGVFGAPTYELDGELFWGQDRVDFLDRALSVRIETA